ncbi:MAG: ATP-binding protein [Clostridiales bacterium]|nr:ATP-binding protein [Clostridiales bacterium]
MIASYIAVILVTLILMTVYIIGILSDNLYSSEKTDMFAKANIIAESISEIWDANTEISFAQAESVVDHLLAGTSIRGVVTNTAYSVLYDTNKESNLQGKAFVRDVLKRAVDGEQADITSDDETGIKMISVSVPIYRGEVIVGGVYLAKTVSNVANTVQSTQNSLVVFSIMIIILIGMMSWGFSFIITSPLEEFKEAAHKISKGDFSCRVKINGHNELAQMGETLNYMCNELSHLEEKRRKFVSDVSHELKTPMAGIKLICDSLVQTTEPDPEMVREFLTDMSEEVDRLTRLIERLLTLTRLDNGASNLKLEKTDVGAMLTRIIRKLTGIADSKTIKIERAYDGEELPAAMLDYDKIYEAVYNIVDNAIKYTPEGGEVKVEAQKREGFLVIRVEDTGDGIPEKDREKVFERFVRLDDSRSRETGGTGLGLAITKEAITMHGGTIKISEGAAGGSVFTVLLPCMPAQGGEKLT